MQSRVSAEAISGHTLSFATAHTCFHVKAGNPSSPGAISDFTAKVIHPTSIVRGGIDTAVRCGRGPSSSIFDDSGAKNADNSSSACSVLSFVVDPSLLVSGGILSNTELPWDPSALLLAKYLCYLQGNPSNVPYSISARHRDIPWQHYSPAVPAEETYGPFVVEFLPGLSNMCRFAGAA